jgi:phospholipid/cholesterol/gamma-HCH transport system ATP-binding protein
MIELQDLSVSFDGSEVLDDVSLKIEDGEVVALIDGSGEGKSVSLRCMAGLLRPDQGKVCIDACDITRLGRERLKKLRERFGFLFQGGALLGSMTVYENVAFPLREKTRLGEDGIREKVMAELDQVGLGGARQKCPSHLSGGMVKRAALARALVRASEIMFFDEPTTGLDSITAHSIHELVDSCHKRFRFSGIIVSHEIPEIFSVVQKVAMLHEGRIRFFGTPDRIMSSADPTVSEFIHGVVAPKRWLAAQVVLHGAVPRRRKG